ncbi:MAG: Rab family GTPase [Promethearchaeota archaeon]
MYNAILKTVILGDVGTGKTTLLNRFINNKFVSNCISTIGVDFQTKECNFDGMELKLMIWDFGGHERFRYMCPEYLNGASGGILMYDITQYSSFSHIGYWLSLIKETNQKFPIILLGAKLDLDVLREVPREVGVRVAESLGLNGFIECSSKSGENIKLLFERLTRLMVDTNLIDKTNIIKLEEIS